MPCAARGDSTRLVDSQRVLSAKANKLYLTRANRSHPIDGRYVRGVTSPLSCGLSGFQIEGGDTVVVLAE